MGNFTPRNTEEILECSIVNDKTPTFVTEQRKTCCQRKSDLLLQEKKSTVVSAGAVKST